MDALTLDRLIESAAVHGDLAGGRPAAWVASQSADKRLVTVLAGGAAAGKAAEWTEAESALVREQMGVVPFGELSARLGRTPVAIKLHAKRRHIPMPSRQSRWVTAGEIARMLGLSHDTVGNWLAEGQPLPPVHELRSMARTTRAVSCVAFLSWAVNPNNWIYFNPARVADPYLARLIARQQERWNDAWWTTGQVAAYHNVTPHDVGRAIQRGLLPARRWANWRVRRSDAIAATIARPGKGHDGLAPRESRQWNRPADAFLVLARAVGLAYLPLAALTGWQVGRVVYRLDMLRQSGELATLAVEQGASYRVTDGALLTDWRHHQHRFPSLARAVARTLAGRPQHQDVHLVGGVLRTWAAWHIPAAAPAFHALTATGSAVTLETIRQAHAILQSHGIEPLAVEATP
jgi:hypothetical protein